MVGYCVRVPPCYRGNVARQVICPANLVDKCDMSIFGRDAARNIFLVTKLRYVLRALCYTQCHLCALHRIFATFVRSSSQERRGNLFQSLDTADVDLARPSVQLVSRFTLLGGLPFLTRIFATWPLDAFAALGCFDVPKQFCAFL